MGDYSIKVSFPHDQIGELRSNGLRLCMASGVESNGRVNYNVVAWTGGIDLTVTVSWKEQYMISASHDAFSSGRKFTDSVSRQNIRFGQSYTLPQDWTDSVPNMDPKAPRSGFLFVNKTMAAAVLYKQVNGDFVPIYFSPNAPLPPGREVLNPRTTVAIWLQRSADKGTLMSDFQTDPFFVDFTGTQSRSVTYQPDGSWTVTE